jgi:hypothetical protein
MIDFAGAGMVIRDPQKTLSSHHLVDTDGLGIRFPIVHAATHMGVE